MFLFTTPVARETAPASPVVDAIRDGAEKTGTGFEYLLATAQRESALDPGAKAKTSSATGLFQFIEQTWLGVFKQEAGKLGYEEEAKAITAGRDGRLSVADPATRQEILGLREDPKVASVMAGALTQRNRDVLAAELGREPSPADLYVAHVLGARGGVDLIQMAQRAPGHAAASAFPEAAGANRSIFYERGGRARSAGEVYAALGAKHGLEAPTAPARPAQAARAITMARRDGPALHGLFRTEGGAGPISDSVARLWRSRAEAPTRAAGLSAYFPRSSAAEVEPAVAEAAGPSAAPVPAPPEAALAEVPAPLPPRRPAELRMPHNFRSGAPLDLSAFMRGREA